MIDKRVVDFQRRSFGLVTKISLLRKPRIDLSSLIEKSAGYEPLYLKTCLEFPVVVTTCPIFGTVPCALK